jgi:hypothetical protein
VKAWETGSIGVFGTNHKCGFSWGTNSNRGQKVADRQSINHLIRKVVQLYKSWGFEVEHAWDLLCLPREPGSDELEEMEAAEWTEDNGGGTAGDNEFYSEEEDPSDADLKAAEFEGSLYY